LLQINYKSNTFAFLRLFLDSQVNDVKGSQTKQIQNEESCNDNSHIGLKYLAFSRKHLILTVITTLCAILGIILLSTYLVYGKQLQVKQGDYNNKIGLSDGDDSRKNIPINSTIGKYLERFDETINHTHFFR
jgi:hypothetical protein